MNLRSELGARAPTTGSGAPKALVEWPSAFLIVVSALLLGCPSKDNQGSSGATSPSGAGGGGTGPLANLESAPFINEVWIAQEGGAQMPFIFYSAENVRVSAQCRSASGQLACDALRQIRSGMPVEIPKRSLTGNISAGTRACMKLGNQLVSGHNSVGSEDGFCRFPDGSMLSTGALEQYGMRVIQ
jgi:hypothetical protein